MEQALFWVTVFGVIVIPLVGWLINTLITKKIDTLESQQKADKILFFEKLDEDREVVTKALKEEYVKKEIYEQAMTFHQKEVDSKFTNIIETMNNSFKNVETDIKDVKTDIKDVKTDVKEVKDLINKKFTNHNNKEE